jgi:hypothetical protein
MVAATQRLDEIGKPTARERILLQAPREFRGHGAQHGLGADSRDSERGGQFFGERPCLHLPKRVVHLHDRWAPSLTGGRVTAAPLLPPIKTRRQSAARKRQNGFQAAANGCRYCLRTRPSPERSHDAPPPISVGRPRPPGSGAIEAGKAK